MSRVIDFTLPSTVPGRTLHGFRCVPEGQVRAVLQLSHGMVEYIARYRPLAEYLADRGILVTGRDHLGFGVFFGMLLIILKLKFDIIGFVK